MNAVNRTLYIPLYGKAMVSRRGLLLKDPLAERIWELEGFALRGKARSKWLTYYMAMRARVFDEWTRARAAQSPEAVVLHIGCGMDNRIGRLGEVKNQWYDLDFPAVIAERRKYYAETGRYHLLEGDASSPDWLSALPEGKEAVVLLEGVSMYLTEEALRNLLLRLQSRFASACVLMDCYTRFAARASKVENPVKNVGAEIVSGVDDPRSLEGNASIRFERELDMTPSRLIGELRGADRVLFRLLFGGRAAKKLYRLFEYRIVSFPMTEI